MPHFTHLHLHTEFSLLDGAIPLDKAVGFAKEHGFKAMGISDHGNIFGAVKFFQKCKAAGIKPILGMESYFTEDASIKSIDNKYNHIVLIVQNAIGYKNLCKLIAYSFQSGFYFKPRIDYGILEKHSEGLIVTTACGSGHIPRLLMEGKEKEAEDKVDWFLKIFGPERFYLEVQPHNNQEQILLNEKLFQLAAKKNVKTVVGCDAHYTSIDDFEAHEVMLSVQTRNKLTDPDRMSLSEFRLYLKTVEEVLDFFKGHEEAVWNTGYIADQCDFQFQTGKLIFPKFDVPSEYNSEEYFKKLCNEGFQTLIDKGLIPDIEKYRERLELEMDLIIKMGFVEYFLIVSDFIHWAIQNDVPVGPGRGSAVGSMVAWSLQITNADPIKYNLLFERFLNPERISMPDIDIDFCMNGREKVINYVKNKYGHDKVCQIITFGTMMAKGVIKDVARVLGFPFEDSNRITSLIPDQLKITLQEAIDQEPRLKELIDSNPQIAHLFDLSFRLEGLTRHASKHAAGIVISPESIDEVLPVYIPAKTDELVTQFAMTELETLGFLKMDFLGLKVLTIIKKVLALIEEQRGIKLDIIKISLDDNKTFELLCNGRTTGVFQLEGDGLKDILRKLQPSCFEDVVAVTALYRPGPLGSGMVEDFIQRKHGQQAVTYIFPELEAVLKETYGIMVYQEQVMKVASVIAGYSLGEADILRKAMGKKKIEVMAQQRGMFIERSVKRGFNEAKAGELFDLMAYFAGYGFNKSHSVAYALIAYQTAYLKANYTAEFMAALISLEAADPDKRVEYIQEAKMLGLEMLQPDINKSDDCFGVIEGKILFGLQGIKNVGLASLENIFIERKIKPFNNLLEFCKRVDLRTSNKRVLENLICAGAFDKFPGNRAQKSQELDKIIELAIEKKKTALSGQMNLFGCAKSPEEELSYTYQHIPEWSDKDKIEKEKEVLGVYLSSHPLGLYARQINWIKPKTFTELLGNVNNKQQEPVMGCGFVTAYREITTKKGDRMAFVQMEDYNSRAEVVLFPRIYAKVELWLKEHKVFVVKGLLDVLSQDKCKIKADAFVPVELFFQEWKEIQGVALTITEDINMVELKNLLIKGKVPLELVFYENGSKMRLKTKEKIAVDLNVLQNLEKQNIDIELKL